MTGFYGGRRRSTSGNFAKGKVAKAICERSGFEFPWSEMVFEPGTGYFVHYSESDGKWSKVNHPQNFAPRPEADAQSLSYVSKDSEDSTTLYVSVTIV